MEALARWLSMSKMEVCSFSLDMGLVGIIFERNERDLDSKLWPVKFLESRIAEGELL